MQTLDCKCHQSAHIWPHSSHKPSAVAVRGASWWIEQVTMTVRQWFLTLWQSRNVRNKVISFCVMWNFYSKSIFWMIFSNINICKICEWSICTGDRAWAVETGCLWNRDRTVLSNSYDCSIWLVPQHYHVFVQSLFSHSSVEWDEGCRLGFWCSPWYEGEHLPIMCVLMCRMTLQIVRGDWSIYFEYVNKIKENNNNK